MKNNNFWLTMLITVTVMIAIAGNHPDSAMAQPAAPKIAPTNDAILKRILPKRVFVTSEVYQGDLGGLEGADAKCQALADQAGLKGTFKAWLSTAEATPTNRFVASLAHYMLIGSRPAVVAFNFSHLFDINSDLNYPIQYDENGDPIYDDYNVWTATERSGGPEPDRCNDWTSNSSSDRGDTGFAPGRDNRWTNDEIIDCDEYARLYCFEQ